MSEEYFDKYLFEGHPALLREVAEAMVALLPECDVLAGMEIVESPHHGDVAVDGAADSSSTAR